MASFNIVILNNKVLLDKTLIIVRDKLENTILSHRSKLSIN